MKPVAFMPISGRRCRYAREGEEQVWLPVRSLADTERDFVSHYAEYHS